MSETRARIRRHIAEKPGIHQSRLGRELDLAAGQLQYHLHRLTGDGDCVAEQVGGKTHYFTDGFDTWERRTLAFLRRETARGIIVRLHANGPSQAEELSDDLDLARSTVSWHLSKLVENGIVKKSDDRPMVVSLTHPERTANLLAAVSPSLPDRLVDRFIRSVDRILD